ncbi:MAG: hypothetical protein PHW96_03140 [Candidatus Nanoarchaeia archaeon]|nr:hypothetical protein [Candidatus Nanoarchaeia archaeon]
MQNLIPVRTQKATTSKELKELLGNIPEKPHNKDLSFEFHKEYLFPEDIALCALVIAHELGDMERELENCDFFSIITTKESYVDDLLKIIYSHSLKTTDSKGHSTEPFSTNLLIEYNDEGKFKTVLKLNKPYSSNYYESRYTYVPDTLNLKRGQSEFITGKYYILNIDDNDKRFIHTIKKVFERAIEKAKSDNKDVEKMYLKEHN